MEAPTNLRVGVDVGGTNTDGVILDLNSTTEPNRGILAWHKSPTTSNPSDGIENVITTLFEKAKVEAASIASVTIGTTHFINAVLEMDRNRLAPVAVLRLCGPFSNDIPPGIDWPEDLRNLICVYVAYLKGGIEVDGSLISDIDEAQIIEHCHIIKSKGVKSIVINGVFAPSDFEKRQEERARDIVNKHYPEANVVISKEVASLGYLERENAAILNASILVFARRTIMSFRKAMTRLNLSCPIFLTQNDGTILPAHLAVRLPIRTFSSGPTNSMCGAKFLAQENIRDAVLVIDIGGTTTDVGMLLASGFPRQAAAVTEVAGVRMNFSCPDVKSIGLGGGSVVRKTAAGTVTIGPDSVGHLIHEKALVFGGNVHTATDYAVAGKGIPNIGDPLLVHGKLTGDIEAYNAAIKLKLETVIDRMKTTADDIPVLLVGGGAALSPDKLAGASRVIKPEYSSVANAIGAAMARVSGTVDTVVDTAGKTMKVILEEVTQVAIARAVTNGAKQETVSVAEMESIPLQYIANKSRVVIKVIGDFDFSGKALKVENDDNEVGLDLDFDVMEKRPLEGGRGDNVPVDIPSYRPKIVDREWFISELDLEWITCGCYHLGTGGGGTPYPHFIRLREMMRHGAIVRVIEPSRISDDAVVASGGGMGSPDVSMEKLPAMEMLESQLALYKHINIKPDAMLAIEIGGGNGLQGMILGASHNMDIPSIDGDFMGRALPTACQITPVVFEPEGAIFMPTTMADGKGNMLMFLRATSEQMIEQVLRAALAEMGSHVGLARGPYSGLKTKAYVVENTISLAWRIGRAVALCRQTSRLDNVADVIVDELGGNQSARVLFKGKMVEVVRKLIKGHLYGEVVIEATDISGKSIVEFEGKLKIPFKNENIMATVEHDDGTEQVLATVPDLISVIDAQNGEALGTPEYRYGLFVIVIGITASTKWTSTKKGIALSGPEAFGLDVEYKPLGVFTKPKSVIEEYA